MPQPPLRAPGCHRGVLAIPDWPQLQRLLDANAEHLNKPGFALGGEALAHLRRLAGDDACVAARQYLGELGQRLPAAASGGFILTGHQPELFHPGVWAKNFAAHFLAKRFGMAAMNVVIDNDNVKSTNLRVPTLRDGKLRTVNVALDAWRPGIPWEERLVADEQVFAQAPGEVAAAMKPLGLNPLLARGWLGNAGQRLANRLTAYRHAWESRWGVDNLEVPLSRLCQTSAFACFTHAVLRELPRFGGIYNDALRAHRREHKIRSRLHPAPDLEMSGPSLETPFWVWRTNASQRSRLFAREEKGRLWLEGDGQRLAALPTPREAPPHDWRQAWLALEEQGIKVRTRALTTTMFLRLCVATGFIHGIGGALYDQLTDVIIERFFQFEPPAYFTLSATLWLRQPDANPMPDRNALIRLARDLRYNPDRFVAETGDADLAALAAEKRRLAAATPETRATRRRRFFDVRAVNARLAKYFASRAESTERLLAQLEEELKGRAFWRDREYAFCLHEEASLRDFVAMVRDLSMAS